MIDRILLRFLAGAALFGTLLFLELVADEAGGRAAVPASEGAKARPAARLPSPQIDELVATTLSRPLFSATRRPSERTKGDQPTDPALPNFRLTGIVIEPGRRLAIFAVPGAKALVRSEGESLNEWRVDSIASREVSLSGPAGTTTLEPKADSALVRPRQAPGSGVNPVQPLAAAARPPFPTTLAAKPAPVLPARVPSVAPNPRPQR